MVCFIYLFQLRNLKKQKQLK